MDSTVSHGPKSILLRQTTSRRSLRKRNSEINLTKLHGLNSMFSRNLIDVTQEPAILEEKEVEERMTRYTQHIKVDQAALKKNLALVTAKISIPSHDAPEEEKSSLTRPATEHETQLVRPH
jgi:hypothetical protein